MRQRGKKGGKAALGLAVIDGSRGTKPAPPAELNDFEAAVWHRIVGSRPDDWFGKDTEQLLLAYCRHSDQAAMIDAEMQRLKTIKRKTHKHWSAIGELLKQRDRETRALLSLSRSMRLTQQSINPDRAQTSKRKHNESQAAQPWES